MYMNVIHIQKLTKSFGTTQALKGIDLTVKQGEVHGFIGPNGAGNLRLFASCWEFCKKRREKLHCLVEIPGRMQWNCIADLFMSPVMLLYGQIYQEVKSSTFLGGCMEDLTFLEKKQLLERFQLDPTKKSRTYSKGNRQK